MRVELHEGRAAVWLMGTLAVPNVQALGRPPKQDLWPYQILFSDFWLFSLNILCLKSPFPKLQCRVLPFGFCSPKLGRVVCVNFTLGKICGEFLFISFFPDVQGWLRWKSCVLTIGFIFLFCLIFGWGVCNLWLGDVEFCIQTFSLFWVLIIWYYLGVGVFLFA